EVDSRPPELGGRADRSVVGAQRIKLERTKGCDAEGIKMPAIKNLFERGKRRSGVGCGHGFLGAEVARSTSQNSDALGPAQFEPGDQWSMGHLQSPSGS